LGFDKESSAFVMLPAGHPFPMAQRKDNKINC
jgi:hypothetical protein